MNIEHLPDNASVSFTAGFVRSIPGEYSSVKFEVGVTLPCRDLLPSMSDTLEQAKKFVFEAVHHGLGNKVGELVEHVRALP